MADAYLLLFDYAARFVTEDDVVAFAPSDPGYSEYVQAFKHILASRELPRKVTFAISETIGLTRWSDADCEKDPVRFRRFRTLTNAVGLALQVRGIGFEDTVGAGNYYAISLIDDAYQLHDRALLQLLVPAFEEFHEVLHRQNSEQSPFILLGLLLVKALLGGTEAELSKIAHQIIDEESKYTGLASSAFLWGCTPYVQLNPRWKWFVAETLSASTGNLAMLREALLADKSADTKGTK